jgi:nicotinamide-nucleotide amidase
MAGFMLIYQQKPIFFLPGVPHQMRELMLDRVIPRLATWQENSFSLVRQQVFKVFGLEEAAINQRLATLEEEGDQVRIGYYPMGAEVHVSLTVRGETAEQADRLFNEKGEGIVAALADVIYGLDNETMASVTGALLAKVGLRLSCAESCTGGLMSHMITGVAGSSAYFRGGVVAYANGVKEDVLGVEGQTLIEHGAVSEETARQMAQGVRQLTTADVAISITGIAGPGGGTEEKPVGTVCFGLATADMVQGFTFHFHGNRAMVQGMAATMGLDLLRRYLLILGN